MVFPAPWVPGIPLLVGLVAISDATGISLPVPILLLAMLLVSVLCAIPSRIVVGADGVERRWLFSRRFVAYRDVAELRRGWFMFHPRLLLREGGAVWIPSPFGVTNGDVFQRNAPALNAIDRALDAWRLANARADTGAVAHLAPTPGESSMAWKERVRGGNAYRAVEVPQDELVRVAADPSADAVVRAGAAALAASDATPRDRERLVRSAQGTANPRLRVVLERAAQGAPQEELDELATDVGRARARK
jgi:hypothetical protein